jgi:hypothetical protein
MPEPQDIFPAAPTTVDTAFEETPAEPADFGAYKAGEPLLPARDDQQLPDTDPGITG